MNEDEWLTKEFDKARQKSESAENDAMSYQHAAEAETYHRIKNDSLMFGSPRKALEVYRQDDTPDYGMSAARVRAIKRYLEKFGTMFDEVSRR